MSNEISGGRQGVVVQGRDFTGPVTVSMTGERIPAYLQDPGRWPLAGDWDALAAGVHRARPGDDGSVMPPYIPRDVDTVVREQLARAKRNGGLVLIVGDSTAGKTRTAFEALRAELSQHRVLAPAVGLDLLAAAEVIERSGAMCAVWLDDLERYLGPDGLQPALFGELLRLKVPVLATMRTVQFEIYSLRSRDEATASGDRAAQLAADIGGRILNQTDPIDLGRVWSASELEQAGTCGDPRIADAAAHHGPYGIAEYLAAGPALLSEWRRAWRAGGHPRGAALVAAAVDLARTGLRPPYTTGALTLLHEHYLTGGGGPLLRPEPMEQAMQWAGRVRYGVTSLLMPAGHDGPWTAFDYLIDHTDAAVPQSVWDAALEHAADSNELFIIAFNAYQLDAPGTAETAWRTLADAGHAKAATNLGLLLQQAGRTEEAERLYRAAYATGDMIAASNLGLLLTENGHTEEAEPILRAAMDAGISDAVINLGILLAQTERIEEAEQLWRTAVDSGNLNAAFNLGNLLAEIGRSGEAEPLLRTAMEAGNPDAAFNLGFLLAQTERIEEAERAYRIAMDAGSTGTVINLSLLLAETGRAEEAEELLRSATDAGNTQAAVNLSLLLADTGRGEEAEELLRRAMDAGEADAAVNLGNLFLRAGRMQEAEEVYHIAQEAGHPGVSANLGVLLANTGRAEEAEQLLRGAMDAGHAGAAGNLGNLLASTGRTEEAERAFRIALDAGNVVAGYNLGLLLADSGRTREAQEILQAAAEAGYPAAGAALARLLSNNDVGL